MGANNTLSFSLGLEVHDFLHKLGLASHEILSFVAVGEALHKGMEGVMQAFERGAGLEHLSKRTGESVSTLYQLQKAFGAVGVDSGSLGNMLFMMSKALGGVNEMGESTQDIFSRLGLELKDLKSAGSGEAMQSILEALSKLDQSGAAKASSSIFGRMGAADAVQISRSMEGFNEAMARAKPSSYVFEKMAETFAAIERSINRVKAIADPFFLGIAQFAAGPIQKVLAQLEKIDLSGLGKSVGSFIGMLAESLTNGGFTELLSLSIKVGFEKGGFYALNFATALAAAIEAMLPPAVAAGLKFGWEQFYSIGQKIGTSAAVIHVNDQIEYMEMEKEAGPKYWTKEKQSYLDNRKAELVELMKLDVNQRQESIKKSLSSFGPGSLPFGEAVDAFQMVWNSKGDAPDSESSKELAKRRAEYIERWENTYGGGEGKHSAKLGSLELADSMQLSKPAGNVFERMGFVTGGFSSVEYTRQTATNTAETVRLLRRLVDDPVKNPMTADLNAYA